MKSRIIFLLTVIAMAATSCICIFDCIEGNGMVMTEERSAISVTAIANETSFYVEYIESDVVSVTVEAESNLLPHIETDINNGTLEIETKRGSGCLRYTVQPKITITAPSVSEIVNAGSGDILAGNLTGDEVKVVSSGSGNIMTGDISCSSLNLMLSGSGEVTTGNADAVRIKAAVSGSGDLETAGFAGDVRYILSGSGRIDAGDLEAEDAEVTISGSGSVTATVTRSLNAVISGSGNIYLYGDPEVRLTRSGSGKVIYR